MSEQILRVIDSNHANRMLLNLARIEEFPNSSPLGLHSRINLLRFIWNRDIEYWYLQWLIDFS